MTSRPGRSARALRELAEAPVEPCPHCGRDSRTVEGVCADCWRAKRPGAHTFDRPPRTEPLFDWASFGWSDFELRLAAAGVLAVVGLVVGLVDGLR